MNNKYSKAAIVMPLVAAIAFVCGFGINNLIKRGDARSISERKFRSVLNLIESQYVDDVSVDSLLESALPALLSGLDPHSAYISAGELDAVNGELEGSFSGVGIQFAIQNDTIMVVEAISGGPAEKVGIKGGDRIVGIDGENVASAGITNEDVFSRLRGEKGTEVSLDVKRFGDDSTVGYTVVRDDVPVVSIDAAYLATDSIGYVRVNKFGTTTYSEFYDALNNLRANGAKDYIIDLRGNTGGYMEMAILMVNEFFGKGMPIVFTRGRLLDHDEYVISDGYGAFKDARIAVLIDEISASSSEIFSGAMQDNDRALVIGRRSFGKGLVQQQFDLPDGSALRLTIARYFTPSGRCIQKDYSDLDSYEFEIIDRFSRGEAYDADSIKLNTDDSYTTLHGRTVYGGGGIMPDIFVPNDTAGVTRYYVKVINEGLLQRYAMEFVDMNRNQLEDAADIPDLLDKLPADYTLLRSFVAFAAKNKIPAKWADINISHNLIVNQLKALIARDVLGMDGYFEIINASDPTVNEAIRRIELGDADFPVKLHGENLKNAKPAS